VFLAANAIPDASIALDGPDCVYRKSEWIYGTRPSLGLPLGHRPPAAIASRPRS